jgi:hypothetical protein
VQLGGQRRARRVAVEALEERICVGVLEHKLGAERDAEPAGERRLAHADRALDDDEPVRGLAAHPVIPRCPAAAARPEGAFRGP